MGYEFFSFEEAMAGDLEAPAQGDAGRRTGTRHVNVYRIARVLAHGTQGLARVLNISNHGLMISAKLNLMLGDEVTVDLSEACSLTGGVVWRDGDWCGLKLRAAIDSMGLLRRLKEEQGDSRTRPLRLAVEKPVLLTSEFGIQVVRFRDISQRGAKIVHDGRFQPGLAVKIQIRPGLERRGVVRWSVDGIAGLALSEWLSVDELGSTTDLGSG